MTGESRGVHHQEGSHIVQPASERLADSSSNGMPVARLRVRLAVSGLELSGVIGFLIYATTAAAPASCSRSFWWSALLPPVGFLLLLVAGLALGVPAGVFPRRIAALGTAVAAVGLVGSGLLLLLALGAAAAYGC